MSCIRCPCSCIGNRMHPLLQAPYLVPMTGMPCSVCLEIAMHLSTQYALSLKCSVQLAMCADMACNAHDDIHLAAQAPCNPAPGRQQGIDLGALFENVKDIYESSEPGLRERAIEEQDRELGIWFQRRTPRGRIDNYVGTAINASPWQLGALPQWLLVPYMIQMRDFLVRRLALAVQLHAA